MATGAKPAADPRRFYIWNAPGKSFSIHLDLDVVEKMNRELLHAAIGHPPRDISGVLLGRSMQASPPATIVEDFVYASGQTVDEDHSSGDGDTVAQMIWRLVRGAENGRHIVGFFRSQRDGILAPNHVDLTNASRLRGEPDNVLLLIQLLPTGESDATFFFWDGVTTQYHGSGALFPFDSVQLPARSLSDGTHFSLGSFDLARAPQAVVTRAAGDAPLWLRLLPTFALFGLVTAGTQMLWPSRTVQATQIMEMTTDDSSPLGLRVTVRPQQLQIRWNQRSAPILAAEKAVLRITDGDATEKILFDQEELRDGYVAYAPKTNDVYIRLEVSGPDGNTTPESVRVVAIP